MIIAWVVISFNLFIHRHCMKIHNYNNIIEKQKEGSKRTAGPLTMFIGIEFKKSTYTINQQSEMRLKSIKIKLKVAHRLLYNKEIIKKQKGNQKSIHYICSSKLRSMIKVNYSV